MSEVFERASVSLILADYAVVDQLGKLQLVGGGLQIIGRDHAQGVSAAFALVVTMEFPPEVFNEQYAVEVVLEDVNGAPVDSSLLRTASRVQLGEWTMTFYREEYADHGRPYGGRVGGEIGHQRPQPPRPVRPAPPARPGRRPADQWADQPATPARQQGETS